MPEGRTAPCSSRCRAERSRRRRVAVVLPEGLLSLRQQLEALVEKVDRLHVPRATRR